MEFVIIDNVKCFWCDGELYCNYEDYLESDKPKSENDFLIWCEKNNALFAN